MVYLDNAATTKCGERAAELMLKLLCEEFGNPSSLHKLGIGAEAYLRRAREQVSLALACDAGEVYFTSGGTESNNIAIFGAANKHRRRGMHIITTNIEHPSVTEPMRRLQSLGYDVTFLEADRQGRVTAKQVRDALRQDTILVSVMSVNNELGSVLPVKEIAREVKRLGCRALVHTDAVQGFLKLPEPLASSGADMITVSGHKIHAPKGIGALFIKKGVKLTPLSFGGGQEHNLRPGTEAMPLIAAFGQACEEGRKNLEKDTCRMRELLDMLRGRLSELNGVHILCRGGAPHILSVAFETYPSEVSMRMLESRNIYISSGSACGKGRQSHVLKSVGVPDRLAACAVRISLSGYTTVEDIKKLAVAVEECLVSKKDF